MKLIFQDIIHHFRMKPISISFSLEGEPPTKKEIENAVQYLNSYKDAWTQIETLSVVLLSAAIFLGIVTAEHFNITIPAAALSALFSLMASSMLWQAIKEGLMDVVGQAKKSSFKFSINSTDTIHYQDIRENIEMLLALLLETKDYKQTIRAINSDPEAEKYIRRIRQQEEKRPLCYADTNSVLSKINSSTENQAKHQLGF